MKKTTILLLLLTLVAVAAGTVTVLATPKYQATAARPTPGPLLVIVTTPSPTPTPTPAPTPVPTPPPVYTALKNGPPVLGWVATGWENARAAGYTGVWTSWPDTGSRRINYSLIDHVVTLSGVSATQVRVNDPWKSGSQYWFSKAAFEGSWTDFNNMAVILQ